ncbi:MAG: hypothetical protein KC431_24450, partial [Myxococcales bacterium]|nr:hypothetical protein [Myxococcales bacterium]
MSGSANPRRVAVQTLRDLAQRQGFSNRVLSAHLERHPTLDKRDRGLITTLVYGVLRHQARLDRLLDGAADKPGKLKGELRTILRVAAFEIVELDRPLAIAAAEAIKVSRRMDPQGRLKGLITAVLAAIDRDWPARDAEMQAGDAVDALSRRWSLPHWLAARWVEQLGPEQATARAVALSQPPAIDLRLDLSRATVDEIRERLLAEHPGLSFVALPEAAGEQPQCLRVRGGGDLFHGPLFEEGLISIQSLGSQQAVRILDPAPGERILDACAGMGTKTVQIAEHLRRRGTILAADASAERIAELEHGARERAVLDSDLELRTLVADLTAAAEPSPDPFDAVLLDAPCTGLGNLARHPELRWTRVHDDIAACAALQRQLLAACWARVREGGRLVHAVCSLEP